MNYNTTIREELAFQKILAACYKKFGVMPDVLRKIKHTYAHTEGPICEERKYLECEISVLGVSCEMVSFAFEDHVTFDIQVRGLTPHKCDSVIFRNNCIGDRKGMEKVMRRIKSVYNIHKKAGALTNGKVDYMKMLDLAYPKNGVGKCSTRKNS